MTNEKNNAARVSDLTVALVVVLLCLYAGFASYSLEPATRFFPLFIILSLLVIVLGHLALVIADLARQRWRSGQVSNTVAHIGVRAHLFPLAAAAIAFLYALSLEPVGYELSSFVFLLAIMFLIKPAVTVSSLLMAVTVPTISYLLFAYGLQLRFPLFLSRFFQ